MKARGAGRHYSGGTGLLRFAGSKRQRRRERSALAEAAKSETEEGNNETKRSTILPRQIMTKYKIGLLVRSRCALLCAR